MTGTQIRAQRARNLRLAAAANAPVYQSFAAFALWLAGLCFAFGAGGTALANQPPGGVAKVQTISVKPTPGDSELPERPTRKPQKRSVPKSRRTAKSPSGKPAGPDKMTMSVFLDRLMIAESGGRDNAKNPRSTATGPFQFIESTFLELIRRHFPEQAKLPIAEQLALRTDRAFSRKLAEIFTRENAAILIADGHKPTYPNLRLAFLLGAGGASRVLSMDRDAPVAPILGRAVIVANPFMAGMTAGDLVSRAARDLRLRADDPATARPGQLPRRVAGPPPGPRLRVRCNLRLPSCQRWVALQKRKLAAQGKLKGRGRVRLSVSCGPGVPCRRSRARRRRVAAGRTR